MREVFKYAAASVGTYAFIFGAMYVAVDMLRLPQVYSYAVVMAVNYAVVYILNATWIFGARMDKNSMALFGVHIGTFYLLNIVAFEMLSRYTDLHYLLITGLNIVLFAALRFLSLKFVVFRTRHGSDT